MKKIFIITGIIALLWLWSCGLLEWLEKETVIDADNINIIDEVGDQALDRAVNLMKEQNQ